VDHSLKQDMLVNIFSLLNVQSLNPKKWMKANRKEAKQRLYQPTIANASPTKPPKSQDKLDIPASDSVLDLPPTKQDYLDALTDYEDLHTGRFERVFPSSSLRKQEAYETFLNAAQGVYTVPETLTTKSRRAFSLAQLQGLKDVPYAPPYYRSADEVTKNPALLPPLPTKLTALDRAALKAKVDEQIKRYLERKKKPRRALPMNLSTISVPGRVACTTPGDMDSLDLSFKRLNTFVWQSGMDSEIV
jgi:hypothetical protein